VRRSQRRRPWTRSFDSQRPALGIAEEEESVVAVVVVVVAAAARIVAGKHPGDRKDLPRVRDEQRIGTDFYCCTFRRAFPFWSSSFSRTMAAAPLLAVVELVLSSLFNRSLCRASLNKCSWLDTVLIAPLRKPERSKNPQ